MKNIGLNHIQATKFLEMCTKLFPDNHDENSYHLDDDKFLDLWVPDPEVHTGHRLIKIYWFEFCMTYLCNKVFIQDESLNEFLLTFNVNNHPVDYLYEEFLKLN